MGSREKFVSSRIEGSRWGKKGERKREREIVTILAEVASVRRNELSSSGEFES